ncbi:MAG: hypothetical protein ABSB59_25730 [Streptosporangiaceae bacterium]
MDVNDLDADPLRQLGAWLDAARAAGSATGEQRTAAGSRSGWHRDVFSHW